MKKGCRITAIEAEYMMWQLAFAWVSEAASHKNADFYNEMRSAATLNDNILGKEGIFYPNEEEIELIFKEANKVTGKLFNQMARLKRKYHEKIL